METTDRKYELKEKRFVVYGLGRSGIPVARLLLNGGAQVAAFDDAGEFPEDRAALIRDLESKGLTLAVGLDLSAKRELLHNADTMVVSPGIMIPTELRDACRESGVEIIGELELAYRLCPGTIIAVTGSNGKTTTACLLYEFMKAAGFDSHLVGNVGSNYDPAKASGYRIGAERIAFTGTVGVPFSERLPAIKPGDMVVVEASSYQLETAIDFHPKVAVLLNITEDHLARHGDMDGYVRAKGRLFINQETDDFAVLNGDDPLVADAFMSTKASPKRLTFSFVDDTANAYYRGGAVFLRVNGEPALLIRDSEFAPPGRHNIENLMAAALAASCSGASMGQIRDVARAFKGVEHRIEYVGEFNGLKVYNDSKGTNPDSTIKALQAFDHPVILILGGYEKGSDFTPLYEMLPEKARHVLIIGATSERLDTELGSRGFSNRTVVGDLAGALEWAHREGRPGETLLLSPASASFDQFESYEERGRVFKELASEILSG